METIQLVVLSVTQGVTEFLPVSSSAHLIIISQLFGWKDQGMVIDTMAHLGSLFAFLLYICVNRSKDYTDNGFFQFSKPVFDIQLIKKIAIATTPAIIVGLLFRDVIANYARNADIISITTIFLLSFYSSPIKNEVQKNQRVVIQRSIFNWTGAEYSTNPRSLSFWNNFSCRLILWLFAGGCSKICSLAFNTRNYSCFFFRVRRFSSNSAKIRFDRLGFCFYSFNA